MKKNYAATINGKTIEVSASQDLLTSALEAGIEFPYNCRVGGCGTCRARLIAGQVDEKTKSDYLLNKQEIEQSFILACQSVPLSDVQLSFEPARAKLKRPGFIPKSKTVEATAWDYLKFYLFHFLGLLSLFYLLLGGAAISWGLLATVIFYVLGDFISGDDGRVPQYKHPWFLTVQLWLALPLLISIIFVFVWSVGPTDALGFGQWLSTIFDYDFLHARADTSLAHHISGGILTGLMIGLIGTITAHELTHRTWDKISMFIGRWLLSFSFDTSFSIEHVYGHHRYVSTAIDPATAPRGRNVYAHILISTLKGNVSAWHIECERLAKRNLSPLSWHNAFLRGHLMSLIVVALCYTLSGTNGALAFIITGLWGKALLEIVNYMEHYGLVRLPDAPVLPKHSWNTNKRISSWTMFNLTRHSHHHAEGEIPYHKLEPIPDAPNMINGYLTTIILTLIPPLWFYLMKKKLAHWDQHFASAEELGLIAKADS